MVTGSILVVTIVICIIAGNHVYRTLEDEVRLEVENSAKTLNNYYEIKATGYYSYKNGILKKGTKTLSFDIFRSYTKAIRTKSKMDYTIFWGDTRILTTLKEPEGRYTTGTKADETVVKEVFGRKTDYYSREVMINGKEYIGYYIPLIGPDGEVSGMIFAGTESGQSKKYIQDMMIQVGFHALFLLVAGVFISNRVIRRILAAVFDIQVYMGLVSVGNFSSEIKESTLNRSDEIGDLARSAIALGVNIQDLIERDPLTGLYNRRSMQKKMKKYRDRGISYVVVMGDVDYFKSVNDTYGHKAGDVVLVETAKLLRENCNSFNGVVGRWGGEEFLLAYPDMPLKEVKEEIEGLLETMRGKVIEYDGKEITVTMTFGITTSHERESLESGINRADKLLYKGKESGRNRVVSE